MFWLTKSLNLYHKIAKFIGWYDKIDSVQHYNPLVSNRNIFGKLIAFNWQCSFRFNKSDKFLFLFEAVSVSPFRLGSKVAMICCEILINIGPN